MKDQALIIIDVQNDFCPGGALAVTDGDKVVPVLNNYINLFSKLDLPIYASRDWHPRVTQHFKEFGGKWPPHAIQGTWGAEFHPDLNLPKDVEVISEGMDPRSEGYSAFEGVNEEEVSFADSLERRGIHHLYIGGLATDYCVRATVLDALQKGFRVTALFDAVKGVDVEPGDSMRAIEAMIRGGARLGNLKDVEEELMSIAR